MLLKQHKQMADMFKKMSKSGITKVRVRVCLWVGGRGVAYHHHGKTTKTDWLIG